MFICLYFPFFKYADNVLNILDKENKYISHRLYRQHTSVTNNGFVKDLSKLGRDLSKLIMIDNIPENYRFQTENGLWIRTWTEDMKDTQLLDLSRILKDIYNLKPMDVRVVLKKIKDDVNNKLNKNIHNPYLRIDVSSLVK